jgi:integrase
MSVIAEKMSEVTDEQWDSVNKNNRERVEEFLRESIQLSPQTLNQYTSALRMFFYWIKENCEDKDFWKIKGRDFLLFQNSLTRRGLSSSAVRFKRSAVSSFNNYIETYYEDVYEFFRNYVTKKIPSPPQVLIHEKDPLTLEEYDKLCVELATQELWQPLAYLIVSFSTGARRNEVRQLLKEIINYEPKIVGESKIYQTHDIRCKGKGVAGKIRKLQMDEIAVDAIRKWLSARGDDNCPYVFVAKSGDEYRQISPEALNRWCSSIFEKIVGRRVHPHQIRETRATTMVMEQGKDIKIAQKLLGHNSSLTTEIYIIRKDENDSDEAFT